MIKKILLSLLFLMPLTAYADDSANTKPEEAKVVEGEAAEADEEKDVDEKVLRLTLGAEVTNQYFFRGLRQENQGFIAQPWAELKLSLYSNNWLTDVRAVVGTWNSFHSGPTGAASKADTPAAWYETRFHAGAEADLFKHITVGGGYMVYTSPNDSLETVHEFYITLAIDDYYVWHDLSPEELLEKGEKLIWNGVRPRGKIAFESAGQRDNGLNNGVYAEASIRPSWTLNYGFVFTVAVPVKIGFSVDQYYEKPVTTPGRLPRDDAFGFTDIGLEGDFPLAFLGDKWGELSLTVGGHWLYLGQNTSAVNNGDKHVGIATGGFRFRY